MARVLAQSRADRLLRKDYRILSRVITTAWEDYQAYPFDVQAAHTPRTRASAVHDHMVSRAREAFGSVLHAQCTEYGGLFMVLLYGRIAMRFKKLDDDFRSSNIPTQQSLDFVRQESDLPGIKSMTNLQAGYRLNRLQTDLEGVYVACPRGSYNHWITELSIEPGSAGASVVEFPGVPPKTPTTTFVLKGPTKDADAGEGAGG